MAKKQNKSPVIKSVPQVGVDVPKQQDKVKVPFKLEISELPRLTPYLPGILLFCIAIIIALLTYKDYGISIDEIELRDNGLASYNYIIYGNQELFTKFTDHHGMGFELLLVFFEKWLKISDSRDIYLMRHIATHILFLTSVLAGYVLIYKLFKNKFIASLGFLMLAFAPRLYAHSFFNTRDLPFLSMILIIFTFCQFAFAKNKPILFFVVGLLCGYATSIRIMGVMLGGFILFFLVIDLVTNLINKEKPIKTTVLDILSFFVGFCLLLYLAWPYLWKHPIGNFIESLRDFSHFPWNGHMLVSGVYTSGKNISWTYFPTWFLVTNPEICLIAGFAGITWLCIDFFKKPLAFLTNTNERNFLLYLACFFAPVLSVIYLHSVIYNDWRHLYFVYPSFVLMALYFINKLLQTKYKKIVQAVCILQLGFIGWFMINNHPFHQVYFNNFVSHKDEYLHNNYDMEYWGGSFKQAIDHILATDQSKAIKINCCFKNEIENNILLLPEEDRKRVQFDVLENADYFITNFWSDPYADIFTKIDYSIAVLNSAILCVYKVEKDPAKQKEVNEKRVSALRKFMAIYPDFDDAVRLGDAYYINNQYDSAAIYIEEVLRSDPKNSFVTDHLARIYVNMKQYPKAIELYKNELKLTPGSFEVYTRIGVCYSGMGKFDSAVYYINKSLTIHPDYEFGHSQLCTIYFNSGMYDSAQVHGEKALSLNPDGVSSLNDLSRIYFIEKNYGKAIEFCNRIIKLIPGEVSQYTNAGVCYERLKKYDSAILYSKMAIAINPALRLPYMNLARIYTTMNRFDSAKKYEAMLK